MNAPMIVEDIRPLIALLVPWAGMIGIMWAGEKRPNLRELFYLRGGFIAGCRGPISGTSDSWRCDCGVSYLADLLLCSHVAQGGWTGLIICLRGIDSLDRHNPVFSWLYAWVARARTDPFLFLLCSLPVRYHGGGILGQSFDHLFLL